MHRVNVNSSVDQEFNPEYSSIPVITESYYPTRLEYFSGKILDGLLTGKSLREHDSCIPLAVDLAIKLEKELERRKAQD